MDNNGYWEPNTLSHLHLQILCLRCSGFIKNKENRKVPKNTVPIKTGRQRWEPPKLLNRRLKKTTEQRNLFPNFLNSTMNSPFNLSALKSTLNFKLKIGGDSLYWRIPSVCCISLDCNGFRSRNAGALATSPADQLLSLGTGVLTVVSSVHYACKWRYWMELHEK